MRAEAHVHAWQGEERACTETRVLARQTQASLRRHFDGNASTATRVLQTRSTKAQACAGVRAGAAAIFQGPIGRAVDYKAKQQPQHGGCVGWF